MKKITLVTGLWNLGRDQLSERWSRSFNHYLDRFSELLKVENNMIIFGDAELEEFVWKHRSKENTQFYTRSQKWFVENDYFHLIQQIRTDSKWLNQVGWLEDSTQAKLELYNPLVMSKMFLLNDARIVDRFSSEYLIWIDAGITNTVHPGYFTHDLVLEKILPLLNKFLFIAFPYETSTEIHGFEIEAMNIYAEQQVNRVARGGFFGGHHSKIADINSIYYNLLINTLSNGYMGTEESIFTLISYLYPDLTHTELIDGDGLLSTFFERAKSMPLPKKEITIHKDNDDEIDYYQSAEEVEMNDNSKGTNLYVTCFNIPKQLNLLLDTIQKSNPELLTDTNKFLIDNSTDESVMGEYDEIAKQHGFQLIRKGNMGVCGARKWAAKHFHESNAKYIVWFEDDMLLVDEIKICRNGLNMHINDWLSKCIRIIELENLDFIKVSYSEFFGDHHKQWAWHNVPADMKRKYFPDGEHRMRWNKSGCVNGVSYLIGDVYYSNWPSVMTKAGNYKIFIETDYEFPYEQTIMSHAFQLMKGGRLRAAVLMASVINHNRVYHYDGSIRKEC
jgi:hypothetical protein